MNTMKAIGTLILALIVASPASAQQGIVMVMNVTSDGQTTQARMQLDRTHVRTEIRERDRQMVVSYDSAAQVMRMIDERARTYSEITEADMKKISGAMAQLQNMPGLPPEVQKQLAGRGIPGIPGGVAPAPARITYTKTGTSKVGQWDCTTYDGFRGSEKVAEVCAAEGAGIDITAADFQVVQQLADMMRSMAPQGAAQIATYGSVESQGFSGFPVRYVTLQNGRPQSSSELTELRREAIPSATWAVPAGYKKQDMGMGR